MSTNVAIENQRIPDTVKQFVTLRLKNVSK